MVELHRGGSATNGATLFCFMFHISLAEPLFLVLAPGEVAGPGEGEEGDGGDVVDEHLHKVLPLHVEELHDGEGPVEGELEHVVPPDTGLHWVVGVGVPGGGGASARGRRKAF